MHSQISIRAPHNCAAAQPSTLAASRSSLHGLAAAPRQPPAFSHQQQVDDAHRLRRGACVASATEQSGAGAEDLYPNITGHHAANGDYEGPQLVPLDVESANGLGGTSEDVFGELAVLLVGFAQAEVDVFRRVMDDMDANFVPVISVNETMLDDTLEAAVKSRPPSYEQPPAGVRRAVVMSGMSTAEVMEVIGAYSETDSLPDTLFGAAVPKNYERNLRTLLAEMYDDKDYKSAQDKLEGLYQQS